MKIATNLLLVLVLVITITAANGFNSCSQVDFCSNFRNDPPNNSYKIDPASVASSDNSNIISATIKSPNGGTDLVVTVFGLQQSTFRVKITEVNSTRYELRDVLDGEPEALNFDYVSIGDDSVTVTTSSSSNYVKINFSPFSIEFSKNDVLEVILNGDRLACLQNNNTTPFAFGIVYPQAVQLYGLHEHVDSLALRNTALGGVDPYRFKNMDFGGEINTTLAMYGAVPVLYGHGANATSGVFLHNAAQQWIDINNQENGNSEAYFMVESGTLDLFVFLGPKPVDIVRQYTTLTGKAHLPQFWALGYHQCRYSYESQDDVKNVISNFTSYNFQLDAIWLDIDYTDGFKYFTWNPSTYSDPLGMQEAIASANKKLVTIIDPHIKVEPGYNVYDGALAADLFVKNPNGSVFEGTCWPGSSSYMDFLNPKARDFYGSMYSYDNFVNTTPTLAGIWNDMNEPSVFDNSVEGTLPPDSLHFEGVKHSEIHNIYGYLHTMATHQGLLNRDNNTLRPFVLTRSHFAGSQKFAAIWLGDNTANWPFLAASYQECLNANILGIVFCGADVGGFNNNPDDELYQRWYQAGAWLPFFRAHSSKNTERREPYLKSEEVQVVVRNAIQTRYKHLPVWYALFFDHTLTGDPIIRPLFYHYPEDKNVFKIDNQLLVGSDILVRPVTEPGVTSVQVYFPGGPDEIWISLEGSTAYAGNGITDITVDMQSIPVFYRRGSVIVRKDTVRLNTAEMADDGLTLVASPDSDNIAYGKIYIDDNASFEYRDSSNFTYVSVTFNGTSIIFENIYPGSITFPIYIENVIIKNVTKVPQERELGLVEDLIYTTDVHGNLLKDIRISPKEKTVLLLN